MSVIRQKESVAKISRAESSEIITPGKLVWRRFRKNKLALIGACLLFMVVIMSVAAPLFTSHSPSRIALGGFRSAPSEKNLLGTDSLGRDVWARLLYGGRISMSVGIVAVSIYIAVGLLVGSLAGYFGGWVDSVLMRITDVFMSFPFLLIAITVVAAFDGQGNIYIVMLVIGVLGWTGIARLVRGEFLSLREREYILAAKALGASDSRMIFKHMLPNAMAPVVVAATMGVASAILLEAALSFLGMGVDTDTASWGSMLAEANSRLVLQRMPWMWVPPGIAILLAVLSINFVGDGLRDALDPRLKE